MTVLLSSVLLVGRNGGADAPRVEVAPDQTTTVVGTFDSLAALVADLAVKANVELRAYDAADRPIVTNYEGRPLSDVLERLLSNESFLLGVRSPRLPNEPAQVAWIRVTGSNGSSTGNVPGGMTVPSNFGAADFARERPQDSMRAEAAVAEHLLADETRVAQFLEVEPSELARSLRHYPHIAVLLRKLRAEQQHPAVVEKLDAVIEELARSEPD